MSFMRRFVGIAAAAAALIGAAGCASSDGESQINNGLALRKARTLKCDFKLGASAKWNSRGVRIETERNPFGGPINFHSIDLQKGSAEVIGNGGTSTVHVFRSDAGLTFVEETDSGNMIFTTVFGLMAPFSMNEHVAVMSRHIGGMVGTIPSQFHGTCVAW